MFKDKYLLLAFCLSCIVAFAFFGPLLLSPNSYVFSKGGDGLQTYYQSIYHVKYDSTYLHQSGMNYPYGESIFFTGGQPLVSNLIKVLKPFIDCSDYMVGITNWLMLMSFFLSPLFIYLLLKNFSLPPLYDVAVAVGLSFFAQQIERMGGHYPLGYIYAIPGMLYFLVRFVQSGSWKWSLIIAIYLLYLYAAHLYYFVFYGVLAFSFWVACIALNKQRNISIIQSFLHIGVQWLLPFIIINVFIGLSSDVIDRTAIPFGFMAYKSGWSGLLFPYGMWYSSWFQFLKPKVDIEWEGLAYIGGSAIVLILVLVSFSITRFKTVFVKPLLLVNRILLAFCIASILCVALAFAFPFNLGLENLLYKLGPVQQFRGIGRFAFVAFYTINIFLFIVLWRMPFKNGKIKTVLSICLVTLLWSEAYSRCIGVKGSISNARGHDLTLQADEYSEGITPSKFQAILPIPFFHIGSENIWQDGSADLRKLVYNLSIQTGLPTFGASMSRTSVSQTYKCVALTRELLQMPEILSELKDERPLLVICDTTLASSSQLRLVHLGKYVKSNGPYAFYEYDINLFEAARVLEIESNNKLAEECIYKQDSIVFKSDSLASVVFDSAPREIEFGRKWIRIFEHDVPNEWQGKTLLVSFWVDNFSQDLIPRTYLELVQKKNDEITNYGFIGIGQGMVGMKGGKALLEFTVPIKPDSKFLQLSLENKLIQGKSLKIESIMIRPDNVDCMILHHQNRIINNRSYN
jgi:hypothetical protein